MAKHLTIGIDIGSWETKIVVGELSSDANNKEIVKVVSATKTESRGIRHGYVVNKTEAIKSIEESVRVAEKSCGMPIRRIFLSVGGIGLQSVLAVGSVVISRADSEITELDLSKALDQSQASLPESALVNRKIIHAIPLAYKIDGKQALGQPIGMKGMKLEVRTMFVTCLEHHLNDLIQAVEDAGLEVVDVTPAPFAASHVMLTKAQRLAGCVLTNIGSETVSIVVYENNLPVSLEVFPIGSNDITNDIALGLRIPLEEAEQVKLGSIVMAIIRARNWMKSWQHDSPTFSI
jgi:cell division protein FtsA